MKHSAEWQDELGQLASALCDGELTPTQAARLEQLASQSSQARRWFLHYMQLHGEMCWDQAALADRAGWLSSAAPLAAGPTIASPAIRANGASRRRIGGRGWAALATLASLLLVAVGWWASSRGGGPRPSPPPLIAARVVQLLEAECEADNRLLSEGDGVSPQTAVWLRRGLIQLEFDTCARVILQGPARFDVASTGRIFLHTGRLTAVARAPSKPEAPAKDPSKPEAPAKDACFTVQTPLAQFVDLGTEFGVSVAGDGSAEVHVFDGSVEVRGAAGGEATPLRIARAHRAVRVRPAASGLDIDEFAARADRFVRSLPSPAWGTVANFRRLVAANPHLIHHYPFEGDSIQERYRDRRGSLDLSEVVLRDGRAGGSLDSSAPGVDPTSNAIAFHRPASGTNTAGVGLQSETAFMPPSRMTVELLVKLSDEATPGDGAICAAVATRETRQRCGFLVAAVDHGQLTHLLDGDASWLENEAEFALIPGEWYYVAATFCAGSQPTVVNAYVANLTRHEAALSWIVRNQSAPGVPAASRLGIGKAFDAELAHAYGWAGELDEIAIYDAELDRQTLSEHYSALAGSWGK